MTDVDLDALTALVAEREAKWQHVRDLRSHKYPAGVGDIEDAEYDASQADYELADATPALLALISRLTAENAELRRHAAAQRAGDNWAEGD